MPQKSATSPTGWWIAGMLERPGAAGRVRYWHNYRLIEACTWEQAYTRAMQLGKLGEEVGRRAFDVGTVFLGLTDLVPVYDKFEHGAEVLWEEIDGSEDDDLPIELLSRAEIEEIYASSPDRA